MENAICPHCKKSYYSVVNQSTTLVYYPPIYKDGVQINEDKNNTTTTLHCLNCGQTWCI